MSSQAETPSTDKSDTTRTEPEDSVRILPIVPPAGASPAPSQTGTERSTATPDTPTITGLDTVAGPETPAPAAPPAPPVPPVVVGVEPPPAPPTAAGEISVERLPTRLSLNKAKHAAAAQSGIFRLGDLVHSDARPTPEGSHMLGIVAWGTALALAGVGVGIRGLAAIIGGLAPGWYQPALIGTGLLGVLLTVAAFVTIQRRYAPWLMLALATIPLAVTIALTIIAL